MVAQLKTANFGQEGISILFQDKRQPQSFANAKNRRTRPNELTQIDPERDIGEGLGWLTGIHGLVLPGVGSFVVSGAIVEALRRMAVDPAIRGIAGRLISLGVPEIEAKRYEVRVMQGYLLLAVRSPHPEEIDEATRIFTNNGGLNIVCADETTDHGPRNNPDHVLQPMRRELTHAR
jgi:hypothetical protein